MLSIVCIVLALVEAPRDSLAQSSDATLEWPALSNVSRPWTRWWWHGSAVNERDLTRSLELYRAAGLGGVEITPIYGVAGFEDQFVEYLSPEWMRLLEHTLREAERLGLGVDMATGTGWPFGGPTVGADDAAAYVAFDTYTLRGGERLERSVDRHQEPLLHVLGNRVQTSTGDDTHPLQQVGRGQIDLHHLVDPITENPHLQALAIDQVRFPQPMTLDALVAYSDAGDARILTNELDSDGRLAWTAPEGNWTLYAIFRGRHGKMVERAAPGGEGFALDHFSEQAIRKYLAHFSRAFADHDVRGLRAFFNDSYEVDDAEGEADWTSTFFEAFDERRGYDLRLHLPALFGREDEVTDRRVLVDYRLTVSDLLLDHFTSYWERWADGLGAMVRNQAHGSPANILDLYAASDIPETEGTEILRFKFASSAANVTGKPLASAEAATWLNEHFLSSLAAVKEAIDRYFLGGINHIVYHGTAYSPEGTPWPGWLFYAAVHFSPANPQWEDLRALNDYVARAQSILQLGRAKNDVLLYLPVFDRWAERGRSLLVHFDGIAPFGGLDVAGDASILLDRGYSFDFISDRQLQAVDVAGRELTTGGAPYQAIVVPGARLMPLETLERLMALAEGGATVIFHHRLPEDVPGLADLDARQATFDDVISRLRFVETEDTGDAVAAERVRRASVGAGQVLVGDGLDALLRLAGVRRESMVDLGLQLVRRDRGDGVDYFVTNSTERALDGWVPIASPMGSAVLFNPMTGESGFAEVQTTDDRRAEVYLRLGPGESIILRTLSENREGPLYGYYRLAASPRALEGPWRVAFVDGGPSLPRAVEMQQLVSWTESDDDDARNFSGTARYSLMFPHPEVDADVWELDLGAVHESARVRLNGQSLGTLIGPRFNLLFDDDLLRDRNQLEIDVSNLMANRIAHMDRQNVPWKRFYNINFPSRFAENRGDDGLFDASHWVPLPSGLIGPVTLTPLLNE